MCLVEKKLYGIIEILLGIILLSLLGLYGGYVGLYGIVEVILGIILLSYVGIVINHHKFPY